MKNTKLLYSLAVAASLFLMTSCGDDDSDSPAPPASQETVDPSDANALAQVLVVPGSSTVSGSVPAPSNDPAAPDVSSSNATITSSNGSTANIPFTYDNAQQNLGGCYVQVVGSDTYFRVPYNSTSGTNGSITLPIGIPTNVTSGQFTVYYCVYDANGLVSNPLTTEVDVLALGSGDLQISLSWDTDFTDIDLYVTEPGGEEISYQNRTSVNGGQLDRDDTSGFGPENIFWENGAPDGQYQVAVDYYSGSATTNYTVTVNGANTSRTFTGTLTSGSSKTSVVTFTKSGDNISF